MNDANPVFVALLFILRCLVPLVVLFGIAYLLRRLGLVEVEAPEPADDEKWEGMKMNPQAPPNGQGRKHPNPARARRSRSTWQSANCIARYLV